MKNTNANIIKFISILFISFVLCISIGSLSNSDSPTLSILLCFIPIFLIAIFFIKEKIWYVWFICPFLFIPIETLKLYNYLIIIVATIPFYIWHAITKKIKLTWNNVPFLDIPIILLLLYIVHVFVTNPFGFGLDLFNDYYGGRGYITSLQAAIAFLAFSSLKTNSSQLGKLLNWSLPVIIIFTGLETIKDIILKEQENIVEASKAISGEGERQFGAITISILILKLLILKYDIKNTLKKIWPLFIGIGSCIGILAAGFRSALLSLYVFFVVVSVLYRRWLSIFLVPIIGGFIVLTFSSTGHLRQMPYGIQRCFASIEFLDVDPTIRKAATASTDWRTEMWKWALDERENFIKDKIWGDGFSRNIQNIKAESYMQARRFRERGDTMGNYKFAWQGDWHNGVISVIDALGYVGLSIFILLIIIGTYYSWLVSEIYKYSKYRVGILYITIPCFINIFYFWFSATHSSFIISKYIIDISIIKLLYCCATKEGLYIPKSTRKEYVPMICRQTNSEPAS